MAFWTYTGNIDPHDATGAIRLRGGTLLLELGSWADLTSDEYAALSRIYVLASGKIGAGPAQPTKSEIQQAMGTVIYIGFWPRRPETFDVVLWIGPDTTMQDMREGDLFLQTS